MSNHLVLIDDTDPDIQYTGPWSTAQNTQLNTGTNGPPYQDTLHGSNVNASFSYSFSGSKVIVLGTTITRNDSLIHWQDPTWECFVDNISIGWNAAAEEGSENNLILCQSDLQDGPHVLSVKVTVLHQQTFWLDQIQYLPSSNVPLDDSTVKVDSSDSAIQYGSAWTGLDGIVNLTQTAGSTVTYQFFGVSLSWLGFVPSNFSLTPTSGIYSIDGQTPISFFIPALDSSNALPLYNQELFKTETLPRGQHELIVTYQGNSETAPLALDAFNVQNASATSVPGTTSVTSSTLPSSSSNSTPDFFSNKSPLVAIIAGVVSGVIVLVFILLLYIGRRYNRRAQKLKEKNLDTNPDPFTFSHQNTSEVSSLTPQPIPTKFSRRIEPAYTPGLSRLTPPSPAVIGARIYPTNSAIRNTEMIPVLHPSTSAQDGSLEFLQHADSGARLPCAHGKLRLVDLPPVYTRS